MIEIQTSLFNQLTTAVWLLDADLKLISQTNKALELSQKFQVDIKKIWEISQGKGCALHSTKGECLNCPLEENISPQGFPFVLLNQAGHRFEFWGRVTTEKEQILLQIEEEKKQALDYSMFDYLNDARESERKKIAQDLHDGIAQSIYSLMLETRNLKWLELSQQKEKLKEIDRHFSDVLVEVRNLAGELRPMTIDEFGLIPALEQFSERTQEMTGFEIDLSVTGKIQALKETERIAVYRIIQEAVANALKYSGTNSIDLELNFQANFLRIEIIDHGVGFNVTEGQGFGLINMKERAFSIDSELVIVSKETEGTKIIMNVPLGGNK